MCCKKVSEINLSCFAGLYCVLFVWFFVAERQRVPASLPWFGLQVSPAPVETVIPTPGSFPGPAVELGIWIKYPLTPLPGNVPLQQKICSCCPGNTVNEQLPILVGSDIAGVGQHKNIAWVGVSWELTKFSWRVNREGCGDKMEGLHSTEQSRTLIPSTPVSHRLPFCIGP